MAAIVALAVGLIWVAAVLALYRRPWRNAPELAYDLLAGGVLALLTAGYFWRTISGDVFQPADGGDLVSFLFPTYRFAARELAQGVLPLWNPHLYGGAPFISDIQAGFLYPPNLLLFLLRPSFEYVTLQWFAIGHFFWAGLGMYVLLRTLRFGSAPLLRPAALFGALAFQFSDPLLIHFGNLNLIAVLAWLPWVLAAFHRALSDKSLRWAALAALVFTVANYAGHAQSSLYIGLALALYALLQSTDAGAGTGQSQTSSLLRRLALLAVTAGLTLLLTAPILFPAAELAGESARSEFTYQETVGYSLAPTQAIGLVTPGFFGRGPALHWSLWQRVETPYAGVATLILAVASLLLAQNGVRRRLWPWLGLAVFGFVVGLGIYAILHGWLTALLPGFGQLRAPARALVLWTLGVSVMAAVGLDRLARTATRTQSTAQSESPEVGLHYPPLRFFLRSGALVLAAIATPLAFFALLLTQDSDVMFLRASVAALAIVIAAGCWLATWALIRARVATWISGATFVVLLLALLFFDLTATGAYTDISSSDPTTGYQHPEIVNFLKADPDRFRIDTATQIDDLWQPDTAALAGLDDVGGIANPLMLRTWRRYWDEMGGRDTLRYDLLNVKYVIARDGVPLPGDKFELALDAPGELSVFRNKAVTPRAWLAANPGDLGNLAPSGQGSAAIVQSTSQRMTLQVQTDAPTYLVLSEIWYPGWRATVNGAAAEVVQANGLFRAIAVPASASTVDLWFAPSPWRNGLIAAAVGLLLAMVAIFWPRLFD